VALVVRRSFSSVVVGGVAFVSIIDCRTRCCRCLLALSRRLLLAEQRRRPAEPLGHKTLRGRGGLAGGWRSQRFFSLVFSLFFFSSLFFLSLLLRRLRLPPVRLFGIDRCGRGLMFFFCSVSPASEQAERHRGEAERRERHERFRESTQAFFF